jgi:tripartite-type tricarboxylate transporter receptor subunit TctC
VRAGAALAINSTIGGHTPIAFTALPLAMGRVKDGKLRGLAMLATKRSLARPDVPTSAAGYSMPTTRIAGTERDAKASRFCVQKRRQARWNAMRSS